MQLALWAEWARKNSTKVDKLKEKMAVDQDAQTVDFRYFWDVLQKAWEEITTEYIQLKLFITRANIELI